MEQDKFDKLEELLEIVNDKVHKLYKEGAFAEISNKIKKVAQDLGENYSISLDFQVNVFDEQKEKSMRALTVGIQSSENKDPHLAYGDSSPGRYLVNGDILKVPHDYCPNCWGDWDFKLRNRICPYCGYEMGREIKLLLDTDICPHCEKGKITMDNPECDDCGFVIDEKIAYWG